MTTFNWGHKIGLVILLFLIALGTMVYCAMQQTNEMMDANYYQQELAYQDVIDARKNLRHFSDAALFTQNDTALMMQLPAGTCEHILEGKLALLRPDDQAKDIHLPFTQTRLSIPKAQLSKGTYTARIHWENKGVPYDKEESLYVQ